MVNRKILINYQFYSRAWCLRHSKANVFHHPHPSILQRYKDAGIDIYRTDRDGAVTITTDGNDLHVNTFIKQKR